MAMTCGLVGRMHDPPNHVEPVGRFEHLGLKVPVPPSDPRSLERLEANGSWLEDVHVGGWEASPIFEVHIEHVNASFAHARDARDLQPVLQVIV